MNLDILSAVKNVNIDGNDMIWIPKFYTGRAGMNTWGKFTGSSYGTDSSFPTPIMISDTPLEGCSTLHPAFFDENNKAREGFYISTYKAGTKDGSIVSHKDAKLIITSKVTASNQAKLAINNGHIMSFWEYQAVIMFILLNGWNPKNQILLAPQSGDGVITPPGQLMVPSGYSQKEHFIYNSTYTPPVGSNFPIPDNKLNLSNKASIAGLGYGCFEHIKEDISCDKFVNPVSGQVETSGTSNCHVAYETRRGGVGCSYFNGVYFPPIDVSRQASFGISLCCTSGSGFVCVGGSIPWDSFEYQAQSNSNYTLKKKAPTKVLCHPLNWARTGNAAFRFCTYDL